MITLSKAFLVEVFQSYIHIIGDATGDKPWKSISQSWLKNNDVTPGPYRKDIQSFKRPRLS